MDIKNENNLIQEAFEVEAEEIGFCLDQKWGDYENPYENSDTALAFNLFKKGWQAKSQAVPEGMALVSRQSLIDLQQKLHISLENEVIAKEAIDYLDSKLSKKTDAPEGFVLVHEDKISHFYQDNDEPENFCNSSNDWDCLGDGIEKDQIMIVNKHTQANISTEKFYGAWKLIETSCGARWKFELFKSESEAKQAMKEAQEQSHESD